MTSHSHSKSMRRSNRQKIVFIIDDEIEIREMLAEALDDTGALVKQAGTAESGLAASEVFVIDVILLDVFMPGKGGIWVIDKLKALHPNAVIITMSGGWKGMSPERAIKAAKTIGAHYGFSKPFDLWEVHDLVCGVLNEDGAVIDHLGLTPIKAFGTATASQTAVK